MKTKSFLIMLLVLVFYSCEKELDITDFQDEWGNYNPELRIEAMIYPREETVVVRIDRSLNIADVVPFTNHDWNDDDENDIDIDYFHVTDCKVRLYHPGESDTLFLHYDSSGAQFYLYSTPGFVSPVIDYGAYVPDTVNHEIPAGFFTFGSQYQIDCDCPEFDDLGTIHANQAVYAPQPPVFLDGENIEDCLSNNADSYQCFEFLEETDILNFNVEYNSDSTTYFYFVVPYGSLNYWVSRYKFISEEHPEEGEYEYMFDGYMYEYGHEIYPLDDIDLPLFNFSKEKIYVVENESSNYKFLLQAFSYEYAAYIQFSANGLPLFDPVVSNLRDKDGNVVMGVLGVSSNSTVNARIQVN